MDAEPSFLILSPSEWQDNAVSNMQIAAELSTRYRVVYVETPGGRLPRWNEAGRVLRRLRRIVAGATAPGRRRGLDPRNVRIVSPLAIPVHGNPAIDGINRWLLERQIGRCLRRNGIIRPVIWSFSPNWQPVAERIVAAARIFHCVDGLHTYDRSPAFRSKLEKAVRGADIVFTPGALLAEELRLLNGSVCRIGHGVGEEHLVTDDALPPAELAGVAVPIVVYAGTLANWVDYDLLGDVARRLPDVAIVLIGAVHALAPRGKVERLLALPNVLAVGYQNYDRLPAFYRRAAVGIVPYRADDEHIRYSTPTKFLDYLAAGLPIVSTRFPAAEEMSGFATIADDADSFAAAIRHVLAGQDADAVERRKSHAREHAWPRLVDRMLAALADASGKR